MLSVGLLLDICFGRAFRLTVIGKNLSRSAEGVSVAAIKIIKISVWYWCWIRCCLLINSFTRLILVWFLWLELNEMGLELDPDGDASRSGPAVNI